MVRKKDYPEEYEEDDEPEESPMVDYPQTRRNPPQQIPSKQEVVVEREVNLSLINDKLNYIISLLNKR